MPTRIEDILEGATVIPPKELEKFAKIMREEVIPEIVKAIQRREQLAIETRNMYIGI